MFKYFQGTLGGTIPTKNHHLGEFPTGGEWSPKLIPKNQPIFQVSGGDRGSEKTDGKITPPKHGGSQLFLTVRTWWPSIYKWLAINWMIQNLYLVNWLLNCLFGVPGLASWPIGDSQKYPQNVVSCPVVFSRFRKRPLGCRVWGVNCFEALFWGVRGSSVSSGVKIELGLMEIMQNRLRL